MASKQGSIENSFLPCEESNISSMGGTNQHFHRPLPAEHSPISSNKVVVKKCKLLLNSAINRSTVFSGSELPQQQADGRIQANDLGADSFESVHTGQTPSQSARSDSEEQVNYQLTIQQIERRRRCQKSEGESELTAEEPVSQLSEQQVEARPQMFPGQKPSENNFNATPHWTQDTHPGKQAITPLNQACVLQNAELLARKRRPNQSEITLSVSDTLSSKSLSSLSCSHDVLEVPNSEKRADEDPEMPYEETIGYHKFKYFQAQQQIEREISGIQNGGEVKHQDHG